MLEKIRKYINETMSHYTDSRQPTNDEVRIAWLVCEVDRLNDIINGVAEPPLCHKCKIERVEQKGYVCQNCG